MQEYVERPLLAEGRKFHLRAYAMAGTTRGTPVWPFGAMLT